MTELFDTMMEQAILMNMPIDLFWYGEPRFYWVYARAHTERLKKDIKDKNEFAWLQGLYIAKAINSVLNGKKYKYPDRPFETEKNKELSDAEQAAEVTKMYKNLQNWTAGLKSRFSKDSKK